MTTLALRPAARLATLLAVATALIAAAPPEKKPRKPTNAERIATQPITDVDARRTQIPAALAAAAADPYSTKGLKGCKALTAEHDRLSDYLGPDFAANTTAKENRVGKLAEAGGKTLVNSIIPFRGLVREVTGAAPAQRRLNFAVDAATARRGFVRGLMASRGCKVPLPPLAVAD